MPADASWDQYLPAPMPPDPAGHQARIGVAVLPVQEMCAVNHSPLTGFAPGIPLPGPPAVTTVVVDQDSQRFWSQGNGLEVWSGNVAFGELPPNIPPGLIQSIDAWHYPAMGYPSIQRNRPAAWATHVLQLNPDG